MCRSDRAARSSHAMRRCDLSGCDAEALGQQRGEALAIGEPGKGCALNLHDPVALGGEIDVAGRAPGRRNELRLLVEVGLGQVDAFVGGGQDDLGLGAPDRVDQHVLVVGRRRARGEDVDADDLGAGGIDGIDQPRQQRAIDRLADLVVLERVVGDADNGHVRVLARQPVGKIRGAHVSQHVLEPQQAWRVAWARSPRTAVWRAPQRPRTAETGAGNSARVRTAPGVVDHRKRPIVPACYDPIGALRSETSASIHALPGRTAGHVNLHVAQAADPGMPIPGGPARDEED